MGKQQKVGKKQVEVGEKQEEVGEKQRETRGLPAPTGSITWNPLAYPHVGDVVASAITGEERRYVGEKEGDLLYTVHYSYKDHEKTHRCSRDAWKKWCRRHKATVVVGGYKPPVFDNRLTKAQEERLALLVEECGEVLQAAGKVIRHGYDACDPLMADKASNRYTLGVEIGHLMNALQMLLSAQDVYMTDIESSQENKKKTINRWLHHQ